jgi:enediyne biosynthesis protein E4
MFFWETQAKARLLSTTIPVLIVVAAVSALAVISSGPYSLEEATQAKGIFSDRAVKYGIDFLHFNGMTGQHHYPEMVGSGTALFDYDNDNDVDVLLIQSSSLGPTGTLVDALFPWHGPIPPRTQLFRNDLTFSADGPPTVRFTDVTAQSGINATGYGMGVAVGDYDNDGCLDVFITNFGNTQLWRSNCNGTFRDATEASGTSVAGWSVSAAFLDFDRDGWLDLFVGQYVNFNFSNVKRCTSSGGAEDYCGPLAYEPLPNRLFRNRRDGTFEDVTGKSGIGREFYGALGVASADFNGDGWIDIFVANDERPNLLWINQKDGTFRNEALLAGCALNKDGQAQSCMGVDAGDVDNDGDEDLIVANLMGEYATLYINDGKGSFEDRSSESAVTTPTSPFTGFGTGFLDYDNDGLLDIMIVNGEVKTIEALARAGDRYPLRQRKILLHNVGKGRFADVTTSAGQVVQLPEVSRGAAFGDVDNDGDTDVVIANNNGPARLLMNDIGQQRHWVGLRLVGKANRDAVGSRLILSRPNGPTLWRRSRSDGSYASVNDSRVLFGLGDAKGFSKVRVYWASGQVEEFSGVAVDHYTMLKEGKGKTPSQ